MEIKASTGSPAFGLFANVLFIILVLAARLFPQTILTADVTEPLFVCGDPSAPPGGPCATAPHGVKMPAPAYPEAARQKRLDGNVLLQLVVGEDGRPKDVKVLKSPGENLDAAAVDAVRQWKFAPGTYQGKPVPVSVAVQVAFHLYEGAPEAAKKPDLPEFPLLSRLEIENLNASAGDAYRNHDYQRAAELGRRLSEVSPQSLNAWNLMGMALLELKQFDAAIEAFNKQIEVDPRSIYAYNNLGRVYWRQRKYAQAEKQFRMQIEINPEDHYAHTNLGLVLRDEKKCSAALPELDKGLSISPTDAKILLALAECNLDSGDKDKGIDFLYRAVSTAPSAETWNSAAYQLALRSVNLDQAMKWAETAITVEAAALREVSLAHLSLAQMNDVRMLANTWDTLGWIHFVGGDAAAAEPYVQAAWQLHPIPEDGNHLAQVYEKLGNRDAAVRELAMALGSERANPDQNTAPEIISDTTDRLAKLAGPGADLPALIEKGEHDLAATRTSEIPNPSKAAGTADFTVLIAPNGKVAEAHLLKGDTVLKPNATSLNSIPAAISLPGNFQSPVVRRGTLTCIATQPTCKFIFMTANRAAEAFRNEQSPAKPAQSKRGPDPHVYDNPAMGIQVSLPDEWRLVSEVPASYSQPALAIFNKVGTMAALVLLKEHLQSSPDLYRKVVEASLAKQDNLTHTADEDVKRDGFPGTRWKMKWKNNGIDYQGILELFTVGDQHYRVIATAPQEVFKQYSENFEDTLRSLRFPQLHTSLNDVLPLN